MAVDAYNLIFTAVLKQQFIHIHGNCIASAQHSIRNSWLSLTICLINEAEIYVTNSAENETENIQNKCFQTKFID